MRTMREFREGRNWPYEQRRAWCRKHRGFIAMVFSLVINLPLCVLGALTYGTSLAFSAATFAASAVVTVVATIVLVERM